MPVFGSFRWGSGKSCSVDTGAAGRTFLLRGDGTAGVPPTADDFGNAVTFNGSATLSASFKYWTDYATSTYVPGSAGSYVSLPAAKFDVGISGAPFSLLMRLAILSGSAGVMVMQNAAGAGSWGVGGIQCHLFAPGTTSLSWQFYGSSSPTSLSIPWAWNDGVMKELLITYDGTTTRAYLAGTQVSSTTGSYAKVTGSTCRLGEDVSGGQQNALAVNDLTVYSTCITTASSYTLPTLPPC